MKTLGKQRAYLTAEDYIISLLDDKYDEITDNSIIKVNNKSGAYNKEKHELIIRKLDHPKLLCPDVNNNQDARQITLDKFL